MGRLIASLIAFAWASSARAEDVAPVPCPPVVAWGGGVAILPERCPAPVSGWLYTHAAHDSLSARLDAAADALDACAAATRRMDDAVRAMPAPPSRLAWLLTGAGAAFTLGAAAVLLTR